MTLRELRVIATLSCDEASRLVSDALDRELSSGERWALRLHTLICRSCRWMAKQLVMMRALLSNMTDGQRRTMLKQLPRLSAERKRQIKQLLDGAARGEPS